MKLKTVGFLTSAILTSVTVNNANANLIYELYAGAEIGAGAATMFADHHNHTHGAQSAGGIIGIDIPFIRAEAEYNYLYSHDTKMNLAMGNLYAKMPMGLVNPYLGGGIGAMFHGTDDNADLHMDHRTAYQGMLGLTFDIPALPLKIDAEARTIYIPDVYKIENVRPDILHYDARLKVRYLF